MEASPVLENLEPDPKGVEVLLPFTVLFTDFVFEVLTCTVLLVADVLTAYMRWFVFCRDYLGGTILSAAVQFSEDPTRLWGTENARIF